MPKGKGYAGKNLKPTKVGAGKTVVKAVKAVGKLNKPPLRPSPKNNTPKKFGRYFKK